MLGLDLSSVALAGSRRGKEGGAENETTVNRLEIRCPIQLHSITSRIILLPLALQPHRLLIVLGVRHFPLKPPPPRPVNGCCKLVLSV